MTVKNIDKDKISSVYSGRNGSCCCGCSGIHRYASAHRKYASKDRGYIVKNDEINDSQVTRIVNKINANLGIAVFSEDNVYIVIRTRLYVAYFRQENHES